MKVCLAICGLLMITLLQAQSSLAGFGQFTSEEINLKDCSFDKNAEAIILFDEAVSYYDDDHRLITQHRTRIKIFHRREVDRGNVRIRFYAKNAFEYISDIKGVTYNPQTDKLSFLENKSIFTEKENNIYSSVKFAMPDVQPGCIIEYQYTSYMKSYAGLSSWVFQHDLPIQKSCYRLSVLPGTSFQYLIQKKPEYPVIVKTGSETGLIYYEMNNIPALRFEPFMDAPNDYKQKVEFQLAEYSNRFGVNKVAQTWKDLAYELVSAKGFGVAIKKELSGTDEIKALVLKETTDSGRIAAIYNYIRRNFAWNGYYSTEAYEGLKRVWEKRTGHAAEINLLLVNLLRSFDIETYPLLVAERDFGKIDTTYPFVDRFNKVAAMALAGGRTFILDATQKYTPPGLTPYPLLNTIAFVVDRKAYRLIRIQTASETMCNVINIDAEVDAGGKIKGTAEVASTGYGKQVRTEDIIKDPKAFVKETFEENDFVTDKYDFENIDDDSKPLLQKIAFHGELNANGGFIFINCNLFTSLSKNPFTAEQRFTNINFGYPYDITVQATFRLPEKTRIDKLPENKDIALGGNFILLSRKYKVENNTLTAVITFKQKITLVPHDQYINLQQLRKTVTDLLNEPVIIKVEN